MKKQANDLRRGDVVVEEDGSMYTVVTAEHAMTGKRTACMQVHMKSIDQINKAGSRGSSRKRYMPNAEVEVIDLVEEECRFLYMDGEEAVIMRDEDHGCDQVNIVLPPEMRPWMSDEIKVLGYFNKEQVMYIMLPKHLDCVVESTEVSMKHQRVTSSYKPAQLTNGAVVQVPSFVKEGDKITVDTTDDFAYVSKAKES